MHTKEYWFLFLPHGVETSQLHISDLTFMLVQMRMAS